MAPVSSGNLLKAAVPAWRTLALIAACAVLAAAAGCAWVQRVVHYQPSDREQKSKDTKSQQQYYDQGLKQYTAENYGEARKAFLRVVDMGPNTQLGLKAQENLKKIERIMKTVEEIEAR
jgi:outer membrane protein assembly factor BamD (BamD/ComL family)